MAGTSSRRGKKVFRRVLLQFFILFLLFGLLVGGGSFVFYAYHSKDYNRQLLGNEINGVKFRKEVIEDALDSVVADLEYLSIKEGVNKYVETGDTTGFPLLAKDLLAFAMAEGVYDQVRLFGPTGMELLRINHNSGLAEIVPQRLLQSKRERYYFQDTVVLNVDDVYVSPMDLNIELGKVEVPYKPVIRFGRPLISPNGEARGALILNYYADKLLGELRKTRAVTVGQTMLINNRGYWLLAPDSKDQWGFMFPDRQEVSFANRYPNQWKEIQRRESGQISENNMVFTFETIYPLSFNFKSSSGADTAYEPSKSVVRGKEYAWKLVSFVPSVEKQGFTGQVIANQFGWGALLFAVSGTLAWGFSFLFIQRNLRLALQEQGPRYDPLTGVAGVGLFYERLEKATNMVREESGGFNLMAVQVQDYKKAVSTYGFDLMDEVMVQLVKRIKANIRQKDVISRVNDNEFVVMLTGLDDGDTYLPLIQAVQASVKEPFIVNHESVDLEVDLGMSRYPEDSMDIDILVALSRSSI